MLVAYSEGTIVQCGVLPSATEWSSKMVAVKLTQLNFYDYQSQTNLGDEELLNGKIPVLKFPSSSTLSLKLSKKDTM